MGCLEKKAEIAVRWAAVSMAFVCLVVAGCKRKAVVTQASPAPLLSVITNRMNDATYVNALQANRSEQSNKAKQQVDVSRQLQVCVRRVQATLATGADESVLKAALSNDQEWVSLSKKAEGLQEDERQTVIAARELIRKRMQDEAQAVKAVEEGRAKAVDKPLSSPRVEAVKK